MSTSVLYELIFLGMMAAMAGISVFVILPLRWLLGSWQSVWSKLLVIHLLNTAVIFASGPFLYTRFRLLNYAGLLHLSTIVFCLTLAIADGVRAQRQQDGKNRAATWTLFAVICGLGLVLIRMTALSASNKEILEFNRFGVAAVGALEHDAFSQQPFEAMRKAFPNQLRPIVARYVAQARAENTGKQVPDVIMPKAPIKDFGDFITSQRRHIAFAPDAELIKVAGAIPHLADLFGFRGECAPAGQVDLMRNDPSWHLPADKNSLRQAGESIAAEILAARAGIDHPVRREISLAKAGMLETRFRESLTPQLRQLYDQSNNAGTTRCELLVARMRWIGTLTQDDAILVLSAPQLETPH